MRTTNDLRHSPSHGGVAAPALQERFQSLADVWRRRGSDVGLGVGLAAGYATIGRIGFEGRYDYGVIGPVVNLASRIADLAVPNEILVTSELRERAEKRSTTLAFDAAGRRMLKGFEEPVELFALRR